MAFFDWDNKYDVGVNQMNSEHKGLIAIMNALHELHDQGAPKDKVGAKLKQLADFTETHFKHEEAYLESVQYKNLKTHRLIHQDLLSKLSDHAGTFARSGQLTSAFFSFLKMWLAAHICGIDQRYNPVQMSGKKAS